MALQPLTCAGVLLVPRPIAHLHTYSNTDVLESFWWFLCTLLRVGNLNYLIDSLLYLITGGGLVMVQQSEEEVRTSSFTKEAVLIALTQSGWLGCGGWCGDCHVDYTYTLLKTWVKARL